MSTTRLSVRSVLTPDIIRRGLPASYIEEVVGLGLDRSRILGIVGASSTLRRKLKSNIT